MRTRVDDGFWLLLERVGFASALGLLACTPHASARQAPAPTPHSALCQLLPAPPIMADSLRVFVTETLDPDDAPWPYTTGERVIFPMLYREAGRKPCEAVPEGLIIVFPKDARTQVDSPVPSPTPWPATTGPYTIAMAADTVLDLRPREPRTAPRLRVTSIAPRLGRDALDAGADVVITSDPSTIAYAAVQPDLASVPLPWDNLYVLIQPGPRTHGALDSSLAIQKDLATGALRVEARPAADGGGWLECPPVLPLQRLDDSSRMTARIVFDKTDGVARALSERLVALVAARSFQLASLAGALSAADSLRAVGLDTAAFRRSLADGREAAYVTRLPLDRHTTCVALADLRLHTSWLSPLRAIGEHVTPLVETRSRAIVRRDRVGLSADSTDDVALDFGPPPRS
jgi:hypothetical protein